MMLIQINLFNLYDRAESIMGVINSWESHLSFDSTQIIFYQSKVKYIKDLQNAIETLAKDKIFVDDQRKMMKEKYNISSKDQFDRLDEKASEFVRSFLYHKNVKEYAVDGNGSFSGNMPAGKYYIFVKSSHRNGDTKTEIINLLYLTSIDLKSGGEETINYNFR